MYVNDIIKVRTQPETLILIITKRTYLLLYGIPYCGIVVIIFTVSLTVIRRAAP